MPHRHRRAGSRSRRSTRFAAAVEAAGVDALIVHARKAWLKGLSPRENRDVPPLDYDRVYRLKAAHPDLPIVLNGGIASLDAGAASISRHVDGVMMGRAAYQEPWRLLDVDPLLFGEPAPFASPKSRGAGAHPLYRARTRARHAAACHHPPLLGLFHARARRARLPPPSGDRGASSRAPAPPSWLMRWRWCWTREPDLAHIAA